MDIGFSEEQEMLRKGARDFLETECPKSLVRQMEEDEKGYSPELWKKMADLGWIGLAVPEDYGGTGGNFLDVAVLLEEMGRACLPGPFFSTVILGALPICFAGNDQNKQSILPRIANGDLLMTLALTEPYGNAEAAGITINADCINGGDYILSGTKLFVSDAHVADQLLCVARTCKSSNQEDGITLFLVDSRSLGVKTRILNTMASDKQCEVVFAGVAVPRTNVIGQVDKGWEIVERILQFAAIAKCAEIVGNIQQVLDMAVTYSKERVQFGKPIGSFQAIQHHCANLAIDVDGARLITYKAAWKLSQGLPADMDVSMAKAFVSDASYRVTCTGHEIFGGIGFTKDHDMQLYYRRAKVGGLTFGSADHHRKEIAQKLLA